MLHAEGPASLLRGCRAFFLLFLVVAAGIAQAPAPLPLISAYFSLDNSKTYQYKWMALDPPLKLTVDSAGRPHLGLNSANALCVVLANNGNTSPPACGNNLTIPASSGIVFILSQPQPGNILLQEDVDSSVVAHRAAPPSGPGECVDGVSPQPLGTGTWAADGTSFYFCIPSSAYSSGFAWARVPLQTTW